MRIVDAIAQINKAHWDLLTDNDYFNQDSDQTLGDMLFIKVLAQLETAAIDLQICLNQFQKEHNERTKL